jgi:hypothetical protein
MTLFIRKSVGFGGQNDPADVRKIQDYLNRNEAAPRLVIDGICGPKTVSAIRSFQARFILTPDGRVDPNRRTIRELREGAETADPSSAAILARRDPYWEGDSARWSQSKKLESLNPDFYVKVKEMLEELNLREFEPKIFFAWRSVEVQEELFRKGRTKVHFSFHNAQKRDGTPYAYAVDIIDRRWGWGAGAQANGFWDAVGDAAHNLHLTWGGDWVTFKDQAHVQYWPNSELRRIRRESGLG